MKNYDNQLGFPLIYIISLSVFTFVGVVVALLFLTVHSYRISEKIDDLVYERSEYAKSYLIKE